LVALPIEQIVEQTAKNFRVRREDPPNDEVVGQIGEGHVFLLLLPEFRLRSMGGRLERNRGRSSNGRLAASPEGAAPTAGPDGGGQEEKEKEKTGRVARAGGNAGPRYSTGPLFFFRHPYTAAISAPLRRMRRDPTA